MSDRTTISADRIFDIFGDDFDRFDFPADVYRVTAGNGGEALLILGSERSALLDCGMAYCGEKMTENLRDILNQKERHGLDYIILSHSHYDHIGALPYVKKIFPDAEVCASMHCSDIFKRPNAKRLMKRLGNTARDLYDPGNKEDVLVEPLHVDRILYDGDIISLGKEQIKAIETKGHTDCSMSYGLEPCRLLFTSESTGMMETAEYVHTPVLKDYNQALDSMRRCMEYDAEYLCLPHFGMLPKHFNKKYWVMLEKAYKEKYEFVKSMACRRLDEDEMVDEYVKKYWLPQLEQVQPKEAYIINSRAIVKAILRAV